MFKNRAPIKYGPDATNNEYERLANSKNFKKTYSNCRKKNFWKCLPGTSGSFVC